MKLTDQDKAKLTEYGVPEHMHGGLIRYFDDHKKPGGFLTAVLENDLIGAVMVADQTNRHALYSFGMWLCNCVPGRGSGVWGSREAVTKWLANGCDQV